MKALFWIGAVVFVLGLASLVIPIPNKERESVRIGGLSLGVETRQEEKVSPILSGIMILCGAGLMIAGRVKRT